MYSALKIVFIPVDDLPIYCYSKLATGSVYASAFLTKKTKYFSIKKSTKVSWCLC